MFSLFKNKTILVTGAAGFIGSHASEALLRRGARVIGFDNFSQGKMENVRFEDAANFTMVRGDCNRYADLAAVFEKYKIDYALHYAATVGVKRTVENPLAVLEDVQGIRNILALAHRYGLRKLLFASSSETYGEPMETPQREDGCSNIKLPYATVKLIGENYCRAYWDRHRLPTTSLRFFNVYGPRQDSSAYGFVAGIFIQQVLNNQPPTVFGDGSMTRDFVFIQDNVEATVKALGTSRTNGQCINIGTGQKITVLALAQKVIALSGRKLKPRFVPLRRQGEILHRIPDITKMKEIIRYQPRFSLDQGLAATFAWYQRRFKRTKIVLPEAVPAYASHKTPARHLP